MMYRSSKGKYSMAMMFIIVIFFLPALLVGLSFAPWQLLVPGMAVVLAIETWLIWTVIDTKFFLDAEYLSFRSGPWKKKIRIDTIRKVTYSDSWIKPSLWKAGLSMKGLTVYYNKFDDIFISPENRDVFMDELASLNPKIQVIRSED